MGLCHARRLKTDLRLDVGKYKRDSMREYSLGFFPRIQCQFQLVEDVPYTISESSMLYSHNLAESIKDGDVINGYYQTEKYFRHGVVSVKWELRTLFEPRALSPDHRRWFKRIFESQNPTFLTIRRTDYVGNTFHGEMTNDYYREALAQICDRTGWIPQVFVFSDEPEWCRENLQLQYPFEIAGTFDRTVKGHLGREDGDLYLMSMCKNAVMANSTFSWWGAWLGDSLRKTNGGFVIGPKKWFGSTSNEDPRDIIPERWIKI
jgi:hypothetical protein